MIYSEKNNVLFVSVPKTGTTSLTSPLLKCLEGRRNEVRKANGTWAKVGEHFTLCEIAARVGWDALEGTLIIGGVRNPWDRVASAYNFYRNGRVVQRVKVGKQRNYKAVVNVLLAKALPFSLWVYLYRTRCCYHYLCDESGELVAKIIHLENMANDLSKVLDSMGVASFTPGKENASTRKPYNNYYNKRTRALIEKRFSKDIDAFGYKY